MEKERELGTINYLLYFTVSLLICVLTAFGTRRIIIIAFLESMKLWEIYC